MSKAKLSKEDEDLLNKLPKTGWFAAGSIGVHGMKLRRLERLGYVEKRPTKFGLEVSRMWDWRVL
jgi:hypothetical protein